MRDPPSGLPSIPSQRRWKHTSEDPEDRQESGLVLDFTVAENMILGDHRRPPFTQRGIMQPAAIATGTKQSTAISLRILSLLLRD